ncbi:MAG: BadF/BadG/BcrA/BcrD ATPase family protein [Thermoprotei archaeon]
MYYLLIDIGKTKTVSVVVDVQLNILGYGISGPADITMDRDIIRRNLLESVKKALKLSNLGLNDVRVIVISWAGLDTKAHYEEAVKIATEIGFPMDKTHVIHDAIAALYAVTLGQPGVAIIAGTGAIAIGIDEKGRMARSGGWGWLIGDEGSGSWIALQALNAASRAYDGRGPYTTLVKRICEYYGVKDLLDIITPIYRDVTKGDISRIARIAILVDEEASKGDEVSLAILRKAGLELVDAVLSVIKRLELEGKEIVIGGVGSVFKSKIVRETFMSEIKRRAPYAKVKEPLIGSEAIIGCLVYALSKTGEAVSSNMLVKFRENLKSIGI